MAVASAAEHVMGDEVIAARVEGGVSDPAGQSVAAVQLLEPLGHAAVEQFPEQEGVDSPARSPYEPAGHSEQNAAPATANVPGEQKTQMPLLPGRGHDPAAHGTREGDAEGVSD